MSGSGRDPTSKGAGKGESQGPGQGNDAAARSRRAARRSALRRRPRGQPRLRRVTTSADLIDRVLDEHRLEAEIRRIRVAQNWRSIVGERIAARTRPHALENGVLIVYVWDSSWLHQLSLMRDELLRTVQAAIAGPAGTGKDPGDESLIRELKLQIGRVFPAAQSNVPVRRAPPRRGEIAIPVRGQRAADIRAETARQVADPELAEIIGDLRCKWDL
ncbi:MAG: DUF721 domain-containing protein [Myxococcota bacterium]